MDSSKLYSCAVIEAETGEDYQEYIYLHDMSVVEHGTPIGVEITQNGKTELFLYDGILYG